jgi:Raf kinase inhibitor-like YbhB/YbcL family protein
MSRPAASPPLILAIALAVAAAREGRMAFSLSSSAFRDGAAIPVKHTCDGADVSPPLAWSGAPQGTAAFALIGDDPDAPAGTWVHWVLYNVPGAAAALPENVAKRDALPELGGALQGRNDFRRPGYGGPCPPPGPAHRYFFKLYALDRALALKVGAQKKDVEAAMAGHVLGTAQLMGTYARQKR